MEIHHGGVMAKRKLKKVSRKISKRTQRTKVMKRNVTKKEASKKSSSIEFCPKCGSIMIPVKKGSSSFLKCRGCGKENRTVSVKKLRIVEEQAHTKGVAVLEKDPTLLPLTDRECNKCGHSRAYWWLQQTRSADEPPTQFFRCEKCKHTWREYK